jgi:hypothetical protein
MSSWQATKAKRLLNNFVGEPLFPDLIPNMFYGVELGTVRRRASSRIFFGTARSLCLKKYKRKIFWKGEKRGSKKQN